MYYVINGFYPTNEKDAVALAAIQFQAKFGAFNSNTHRPGFLTKLVQEFFPTELLRVTGKEAKTAEQWETLLFHKLAFSTTATPREAYLDTLKRRDYYGSSFFVVRQRFDRNLPKKLFLAVSRRGILLLKIPKSYTEGEMETIASFKLADVYRWAYKPAVNFYFEVKLDMAAAGPGALADRETGRRGGAGRRASGAAPRRIFCEAERGARAPHVSS